MIDQQATILAVRKIGEGFIALSRALDGKDKLEGPSPTGSPEDATATVATFKCPGCGGPMRVRVARASGEMFAGCVKYPDCKGTRNLSGVSGQRKSASGPSQLDLDEESNGDNHNEY